MLLLGANEWHGGQDTGFPHDQQHFESQTWLQKSQQINEIDT